MSYPAIGSDVERFRAAIIAQIGLQFDDAKLGFLQEVLQRRLDKLGRSGDAYLAGLEHQPSPREITTLAQDLTVGETYFFRNKEQFRALAEAVLPERLRRQQPRKVLRLLSAGCASGEEAYSMAILARETLDPACEVVIRAVDINPAALEKARRGRYSSWALRETSLDIQHRWFRANGRDFVLAEELRAAVAFDNANLASEDPELWRGGAYDAIFCRNVLMYFAPEQMHAVIARIVQALAPGGFLFLGHAETLRGVSDAFHLRHTHDTFYYELKERGEPTQRAWTEPPSAAAIPAPVDAAWFDQIRAATDRVAALFAAPPAEAPEQPAAPAFDLAPALDHLRNERFSEALDHVRSGPPAADKDPDVLLLKATLLAHSGQLAAAEDACHRLLLIDELNAGAHYVLALCCEHAGERDHAGEHDRVAAYLDPAFAMPRLHLGLIAKRAGDRETARRELTQARALLKREDASRLLLFGGGFGREALMAVCESALREYGARS